MESAARTSLKYTALYERLSRDDGDAPESNSIANQKRLLTEYATEQGFLNLRHFTDDGFSGSGFERPGFQELLAEIERGHVFCVIVKDLSRLGRDYLGVGYYTEVYFPERGVRFIAVSNGVDSLKGAARSDEFVPFLNVMNEWYLRDCSRKTKAAFSQKGLSGKPMSPVPPYGYVWDASDHSRWLVDEVAAAVVRRIFAWVCEGMAYTEIAKRLREEGVVRPSYYRGKKGVGNYRNRIVEEKRYMWEPSYIRMMVRRPEYMGDTVNFRTDRRSYKDKRYRRNAREDWVVFQGTHEGIVSREVWEKAQQVRGKAFAERRRFEGHVLKGRVVCADCGKTMMLEHNVPAGRGSERGGVIASFQCCRCLREGRGAHYVRAEALSEVVLEVIRRVVRDALSDEEGFMRRWREGEEGVGSVEAKKELRRKEKRVGELSGLFRRLYEDFAGGRICEQEFMKMAEAYEGEQRKLGEEIGLLRENKTSEEGFLSLAKRYGEDISLTEEVVEAFLERVAVYGSKSSGRREVSVYLKFIGKAVI